MRIAACVIAMGMGLVAACSTSTPVQEMARPGKFTVLQMRDVLPGIGERTGPTVIDKAKVEKAEGAKIPGTEKAVEQARPEGQQPGQPQAKPPAQEPGQQPPGQPKQPEVMPRQEQQPGGGGGPQMDQQAVQKVSQALAVDIVNQAQAQDLQLIDKGKIKLDAATDVSGTVVAGVAPQILDILRPHIGSIRFKVRHGLFVPMVLVGTSYMPVVATVGGRTATVVFVQDCASGQLIPNTILI